MSTATATAVGWPVPTSGECRLRRSQLHRQGAPETRYDQRQAAELFGGGVNAFSRYENGKTKAAAGLGQAAQAAGSPSRSSERGQDRLTFSESFTIS